jgi:putative transposase
MARAKRHYLPWHIWHIAHRCHKSEFLLKFAKDRRRWLQWLFEAKKRYGLPILDYAVTHNHIHLLVVGDDDRDVIPNSIKLIAGRTGQEYNQRKNRKRAFWQDRHHATAVESGYTEIQKPRRKTILIDYERLRKILGFNTYDRVITYHKGWVEDYLENGKNIRDEKWTRSIAVDSRSFGDKVKSILGALALGRKSI